MSIKVSKLTKRYGEQLAANNLSFEVNRGQICGFLGPNGAGKTTTMKMLSCYTIPTSGSAYVAGFDVEKNPHEVRSNLGYLPEHNPLYKNMYVKEYLHFVGQLFRVSEVKKRVDELIEVTGLTKEQHKRIQSLSKGYRQRVGLAQAIIHDPDVLVLDEPTSGLDPNQLAEIRQLIQHLGQNKTVLFSSHIMQEVEAICDRIIIINNGNLVADESKDVLKNRLAGNQRVELLFERAPQKNILEKLSVVQSIKQRGQNGFVIWSKGETDIRRELFLFAKQNNYIILEMKELDVSVESVFQQLTSK